MNPLASSRCHEGPNRLTFPDILFDPQRPPSALFGDDGTDYFM